MQQEKSVVREREAMLAGMAPLLEDTAYVFCSTDDPAVALAAADKSLAIFREAEATSLVLTTTDAVRYGFDVSLPMRRIILQVHSALDGIGLTAAVATALGDEDIPCNIIAAFHHDHIFVPEGLADRAQSVLLGVQQRAQGTAY